MDAAPNRDELKEPGQSWQMFLETLLWVSAFGHRLKVYHLPSWWSEAQMGH